MKQKQGAESREKILDAAVGLIFERGYSGTTISALCKRSGLLVSSVYHHFGSKDGVLAAVVKRESERFFTELPRWDDFPGEDVVLRFRSFMEAVGSAIHEDPKFFRILVTLSMEPADISDETIDSIRRVREGGRHYLDESISAMVEAVHSSHDPVEISSFCLAVLEGSAIGRRIEPGVLVHDLVFRQLATAAIALASAPEDD
ncbi:TetR/AcrR family transcriptional regulator [Leifsonia kafniensis]